MMKDFTNEKLLQEKADSRERSKEARLQAKAEYAKSLDSLNKKKETGLRNLKKMEEEKISSLSSQNKDSKEVSLEIKACKKSYRKEKRFFLKSISSEKKKCASKRNFDSHYRHYVSSIDAFFSRPPMWVVNVVTFVLFFFLLIYFGISSGSFTGFGKAQPDMISKFFLGFIVPDYSMFFAFGDGFEQCVFYLCLQTFAIAFVGTLLASLFAIPFGFLASHKLLGKWAIVSEILLILIRTFPEIVFCILLVQITGIGPITGVVVLSIQSIGMVGKMYSDDLDSMNMNFLESLNATGGTTLSKIRVGVFPQVSSNFISTILYRFDLNLRNASILGLVGAGDMGRLILTYSNNQNWPQLGALLWGLLIMIMLVDFVSTKIRKKLV